MIKVLIANDQAIVRKGLEQIILDEFTDAVIDFAVNDVEVMRQASAVVYNLIILDINLPGDRSVSLFSQLLTLDPELRILICSDSPEKIFALRYLRMGVSGYIEKSASNEELKKAIKSVLANKIYYSYEVTDHIADVLSGKAIVNPLDELSDKEFEIYLYLLKGLQVNEIADMLEVHQSTIAARKVRILKKANVNNTTELLDMARSFKIIN